MISFIIPSYNASSALSNQLVHLLNYLKANSIEAEVIVVDDGSDDNDKTKKVVEQSGCLYLKNPVNMGKGAAVRNGMLNSKGSIRIFTDADIPFEMDAIRLIIESIDKEGYDMVVGDRTLAESLYHEEISKKRKLGSNFFSFIVSKFISGKEFDTQCGLKAFTKAAAEDLFSSSALNGFAFDVEIIAIAMKRNYRIKKIPVRLRSQEGTSVSLLKHAPGMVVDLCKIKWHFLTGRYNKNPK